MPLIDTELPTRFPTKFHKRKLFSQNSYSRDDKQQVSHQKPPYDLYVYHHDVEQKQYQIDTSDNAVAIL